MTLRPYDYLVLAVSPLLVVSVPVPCMGVVPELPTLPESAPAPVEAPVPAESLPLPAFAPVLLLHATNKAAAIQQAAIVICIFFINK